MRFRLEASTVVVSVALLDYRVALVTAATDHEIDVECSLDVVSCAALFAPPDEHIRAVFELNSHVDWRNAVRIIRAVVADMDAF